MISLKRNEIEITDHIIKIKELLSEEKEHDKLQHAVSTLTQENTTLKRKLGNQTQFYEEDLKIIKNENEQQMTSLKMKEIELTDHVIKIKEL